MNEKSATHPRILAQRVLQQLIVDKRCCAEELGLLFRYILDTRLDAANSTTFGALFAALQSKGPTEEELLELIRVVLEFDRVEIPYHSPDLLCGIVGSGKDDFKTFNVSTAAAIVAAASGSLVVKNGSRSESSIAGTTDVLEALGFNIRLKSTTVVPLLDACRLTFCDAETSFPRMSREYVGRFLFFHPLSYTLSIASGLRFNRILFGVSSNCTELIARLLVKLGLARGAVVAGRDQDGRSIDEISAVGPTTITEFKKGKVLATYDIRPEDFDLSTALPEEIEQSASVAGNARILHSVLKGDEQGGRRCITAMNAGAVLYLSGITSSLATGIEKALATLDSGAALEFFEKWVRASWELDRNPPRRESFKARQ